MCKPLQSLNCDLDGFSTVYDKSDMYDIQKPWPLGLPRTWPAFAAAFLVVLAVLASLDVYLSRTSIGWPEEWRRPFFLITDYGLADWTLYPGLIGMILFGLLRFPLQGLWKKASGEMALFFAFIFIGTGFPGLMTMILKRIIGRVRPVEFEQVGAFAFQPLQNWVYQSFPSGHSTTAIAMAFTFGFFWPRSYIPFLILGIIVCISRVPVGMHYPTDIFAGFVVGMLGCYAVRNFFGDRGWLFEKTADGRYVRKPMTAVKSLFQRA